MASAPTKLLKLLYITTSESYLNQNSPTDSGEEAKIKSNSPKDLF